MTHFLARRVALIACLAAGLCASFGAQADEDAAAMAAPSDAQRIAPYQARFGRTRPLVAVVGHNAGTELTDFVIPYGVLSDSGAADVLAVATQPGPLRLRPALKIEAAATTGEFDQRYADGADYVIVPAVRSDKTDDPALLEWLKAQADKGATIVSICDGALVVAKAGLFKGSRATGHWATQAQREREFPDTQWVKNTRYVVDGKRVSSAGVTAALPVSLALVEAIAGHERAMALANRLGVAQWSAQHDSEQFHLGLGTYLTVLRSWLSPHEDIGIPVAVGVDDIALALTADAYSRTYRSQALSVAASGDAIRTRHGLMLIPDRVEGGSDTPHRLLAPDAAAPPAQALDRALAQIADMYGAGTARFVSVQLEYAK